MKYVSEHKTQFIIGTFIFVIIIIISIWILLPKYLKKKKEFKYQVVKAIKDFKPSQRWSSEEGYHGELQGWLRARYPNSKVEKQMGSSRPDIVIKDIAVEIKGPTTYDRLDTIANKCMRYKNYFKGGLIVVLFDVLVGNRMYNEWKISLLDTFPETIIIKK